MSATPVEDPTHAQARLALLLRQVEAVVWSTDRELRLTTADGQGMGAAALGRRVDEVLDADSGALLGAHVRALAGESASYEVVVAGRTMLARVEPLRDAAGAIVGVLGAAQDVTESRRNSRELLRQRAFLQAVIDACPAIIFTKDARGRYTMVNRLLAQCYGRTTDEVVGATDEILVDPALAAEWRAADARVLSTLQPLVLPEHEMHATEGGSARWFQAVKVPLHIPGDPEPQVLGVAMDITDRKQMERALTEQGERFRKVVEQSLAGIYILDSDRFDYVNPRFAQVFGYEPWEITTSCRVSDLVSPEDRDKVAAMIRARLQGGARSMHYGFRGLRRDGTVVHVEVHGGPVGEGENRRILGVLLDVSAEIQAEQRLHSQERRFRSLTENLQDVIWVVDGAGVLQYVSPSVEQVLGYGANDVMFRPVLALVHPEDAAIAQRALEESVTAEVGVVAQFRARHRNGSWRLVESNARNMTTDPAIAGVVVSLRDVTERTALQEQLRQAQKMEAVGQLAGGVAHDFNNILTAIHGYVELLLEELEQGSALREFGEEIGRASERAAALTAQLLAFSRKQVLKPQVFDLGEQVLKLQRMLGRLIREDITLLVERPQRAWRVKADPAQFEQVVMNLVVNARDAVAAGGHIRLRLMDAQPAARDGTIEPAVVLEVSDDGCGMDAATLERVFDPFFTTKPAGQGTGLGLSTVYGIVAQSNGRVDITSAPGQGTTVRVHLPLVQDAVAEASASGNAVRGGSERLLLVEDDEQLRLLGQRALQRAGYDVVSAPNGAVALQRVRAEQGRFDLLVTDVVMPGLNGRELVQALHAEGFKLPVLYVSGYTEDEIVRRGVASEQDYLLNKPFPGSVLVHKVREVLDAHATGAREF